MQLALSRRANLGEDDADVSEQLLAQSPLILPDHESDSDTDRFIKSVEEVLAAAANDRERRRNCGLRADTEATQNASRLVQGGRGGKHAPRKLQAEELQTEKVQGGRSKPGSHQDRGKTKRGERVQHEGKGGKDSPTRKKIKRFLLNEEKRGNRYYNTKPGSPRVK